MKIPARYPLEAAAQQIGLSVEVIIRFIAFEWVIPADRSAELHAQLLDAEDIARARLIWQLQQDFGVNDEAIPIILHLLDQLNRSHLVAKK